MERDEVVRRMGGDGMGDGMSVATGFQLVSLNAVSHHCG